MIAYLFGQLFAYVCYLYLRFTSPKIPKFDADKYRKDHDWSLDASGDEDTSIRQFRINVSDDMITDLKERLSKHRVQESIVQDFEYGFNSRYLKQVIEYWLNVYDWRKEETFLNTYDHFKTRIEGIDIHFVHIKANDAGEKQVIPVLMVHGWPGSFYEFYKSIPYLMSHDSDEFALELVIPSVPGYGFSNASERTGFSPVHAGRIFVKLMQRLGHKKFVYQGGDWGSIIGRNIAVVFPGRLIGYHTNMPVSSMSFRYILRMIAGSAAPSLFFDDPSMEAKMIYPLRDWFFRIMRESGYMHLQSTKPDTAGVALNNDPAGLAAYIMEKFSTWTGESFKKRPDGGLTLRYTMDELLTNVMIYWINGNITSSMRLYKEQFSKTDETSNQIVTVKSGIVIAANELFARPASLLKEGMTNVVHVTKVDNAGHFFAFEQPQVFAQDVKAFVSCLIKCVDD